MITSNEILSKQPAWLRFINDVSKFVLEVYVVSDFGTIRKIVTANRDVHESVDVAFKQYTENNGSLMDQNDDDVTGIVVHSLHDDQLLTIHAQDMLSYSIKHFDNLEKNWEELVENAAIDRAIIRDTFEKLELDDELKKIGNILYFVEDVPYSAWLSYLILNGEQDLLSLVEASRTSKMSKTLFNKLKKAWIEIIYKYKNKAIEKLETEKEQLKTDQEACEEIDIIIQMIQEIDFDNDEAIYTQEFNNRLSYEPVQPGVGNQSLEELFDYWPVLLLPKPFSNDSLSRKDLVDRIRNNKLGLNHDYDPSGDDDDFMNYHIDEIEDM